MVIPDIGSIYGIFWNVHDNQNFICYIICYKDPCFFVCYLTMNINSKQTIVLCVGTIVDIVSEDCTI